MRALLLCLSLAEVSVAARIRNRISDKFTAEAGFPWKLPSCSLDSLSSEDVKSAVDWKTSSAGNSGGVHFLALKKGCLLVVKPTVDLHDLFAMELGAQIGAPVVPSRAVGKTEPLFDAVLQGIYRGAVSTAGSQGSPAAEPTLAEKAAQHHSGEQARESFSASVGKIGAIQLLGVAPGKDLYDFAKGFDFRSCAACAGEAANEAVAEETGGLAEKKIDTVLYQVVQQEVSMFYKSFVEEVQAAQSLRADSPELPEAVRQWMLQHPSDKRNPLSKLEKTRKAALRKHRKLSSQCEGRNGAQEQNASSLPAVSAFIEACTSSEKTMDQLAALSAFASLIGENDGIPTVEAVVSNMHNVFVSPASATGIDMAIGGALSHSSIRDDGTGGGNLADWAPFLLNDLLRAGRCGNKLPLTGAPAFEHQFRLKLQMPYFNGDIHKHAFECQVSQGRTISESTANKAAEWITGLVPGHLAGFISKTDVAMRKTALSLEKLGLHSEIAHITGWLKHRITNLRLAKQTAITRCQITPEAKEKTTFLKSCNSRSFGVCVTKTFEQHGREVVDLVMKCSGMKLEDGLGMCCVKACHHSTLSRLGCLKDCLQLSA